jgi:predicted protein tyrosine phosphatase
MSLVSEEGLYLGSKRSSSNLDFLKESNISLIVNVTDDLPNVFARDGSFEYITVPLRDLPEADLEGAFNDTQVLSTIKHALSDQRKVLVHCRAGSSRSASVVLAHLVLNRGLSLMEAREQVSMVHPIKPNAGFSKQLIGFEVSVRGSASVAMDSFGNWKAATST